MTPRVYKLGDPTMPKHDVVRIDRTTVWGNPYHIGPHGTRAAVIAKHKADLDALPVKERNRIRRFFKGQSVACHCAPLPCHGQNYLDLAATPEEPEL